MKRVLIVEDSPEIRNELIFLFRLENFDVIEAENGKMALALAEEYLPDFIVSDINMPVMDGLMMQKELQKSDITSGIPLIFVSGIASDEISEEMPHLFLRKPFTVESLLSLVSSIGF